MMVSENLLTCKTFKVQKKQVSVHFTYLIHKDLWTKIMNIDSFSIEVLNPN